LENTDFTTRINLTSDSDSVVELNITDVRKTDMGFFALFIPALRIYSSQAILFIQGTRNHEASFMKKVGRF
jgi:hypothetical protein